MTNQNHSSNANRPDLDWSQVKETINMLTLAVAQIESSMKESETAVANLTETFTSVATKIHNLANTSQALEDSAPDKQQNTLQLIKSNSTNINAEISNAIIAFQFYDRLSQRLDHVKRNLLSLSDVINTPEQLYNPLAWKKLQSDISSNHTVEAERIMFEHIMNGASIDQALEVYKHHFDKGSEDDDDIELF